MRANADVSQCSPVLSTFPRCSAGLCQKLDGWVNGWIDGLLTFNKFISPLQEEVGGHQSASLVPSRRPLPAVCLSNGGQEAAETLPQPMQLLRRAELPAQGCGVRSRCSREQEVQDRRG